MHGLCHNWHGLISNLDLYITVLNIGLFCMGWPHKTLDRLYQEFLYDTSCSLQLWIPETGEKITIRSLGLNRRHK